MEPQTTKQKIDTYIEALFQVLPASNYEEIRRKLQKELGARLKIGRISQIIGHLRKNVDQYGWTIPHVGTHANDGEQRYFAVLVEKDGAVYFDPAQSRYISEGSRSLIKGIATQSENMRMMIDVCLQYERSKNRRDHLEDVQESVAYIAKRTKRMAAALNAELDRLGDVAA